MKVQFHVLFSLPILFSWSSAQAAHPELEKLVQRSQYYSCLPPVTRGEGPEVWQAMVILDLDETLLDSSQRMLRAYHRVADELCTPRRMLSEEECAAFRTLTHERLLDRRNRYDFQELVHSLGLSFTRPLDRFHERAVELYLDGTGLELDVPLPGAMDLITRLRKSCTRIYFVSSRYDATQEVGTRVSLARLGMMKQGDRSHVLLRKDRERSLEFKRRAYREIQAVESRGESKVIGVFENEPENMNALMEFFPEAQAFYIEGAYLHEEPLNRNPVRLRNFL